MVRNARVSLVVPGVIVALMLPGVAGASGRRGATSVAGAPDSTSLAGALDREISDAEKEIVAAADAMPENRFDFSPEALNISGADYKGVRSFSAQVKHIAASNYAIWGPLTRETIPDDFKGENGPARLTTKAEILQFLRDSFALGHRAVAGLTAGNMLEAPKGSKSTRLRLATFAVSHAFDHYGQIIEYLRMNGIVPPASR